MYEDFSVVKTLCFQCRRHGFDPWSGNKNPAYHVSWLKEKKKEKEKNACICVTESTGVHSSQHCKLTTYQ